jgi:hypothetical protein
MKVILLFIPLAFLLSTCIKNNPDPAWLEVNDWTLMANANYFGAEGALTENLTEAWVYVNDDLIGVFEVPFKIPILKSGAVDIKVFPAIKNNGISATKKVYPFLETYQINAVLVANETLTISPTTKYKDNLFFTIEDFEDINTNIVNDPNTSAASFSLSNNNLQWFNGNFYAKVALNATDSTWIAYTNWASYIPKGIEVYLEIDYRNSNSVTTGLLAISPSGTLPNTHIRLNAQKSLPVVWKKIYLDLREMVSASANGAYFEHSFEAYLDEGLSNTEIEIDNIKLIHF